MMAEVSDFRKAVSTIEESVYGIAVHNGPQYQVFGTGFLIHEDGWLLTNRHVLKPQLGFREDSNFADSDDIRALQYRCAGGRPDDVRGASVKVVKMKWLQEQPPSNPINARGGIKVQGKKSDLVLPPASPDIGICQIDISRCPDNILPLIPARIVVAKNIKVGSPVGILGFPQGLKGPEFLSALDMQLCPLFQSGCIAGNLPHNAISQPTQYILDIYVNKGSSGSPLFTPDGNVVGVVFASRQQLAPIVQFSEGEKPKTLANVGVSTGTSLGCAVPSSAFAKQLNELFPGLIDIPEDHSAAGN